jgi:hypothetical protein
VFQCRITYHLLIINLKNYLDVPFRGLCLQSTTEHRKSGTEPERNSNPRSQFSSGKVLNVPQDKSNFTTWFRQIWELLLTSLLNWFIPGALFRISVIVITDHNLCWSFCWIQSGFIWRSEREREATRVAWRNRKHIHLPPSMTPPTLHCLRILHNMVIVMGHWFLKVSQL